MTELGPFLEVARERLDALIGVDLGRGGLSRAISRHVASRVEALALSSPYAYRERLAHADSEETRSLIDVATVPHSWLFRDPEQIHAVDRALATRPIGRLRILVPGCASGEDAYTFAALALARGHEPDVLAFDVNEGALARARLGSFGAFAAREIPDVARRYFPRRDADSVAAADAVKRVIRFVRHSLVDPIPSSEAGEGFDLVVCRNVLIYFERLRALAIARRLAASLSANGMLLLGASDLLVDAIEGLEPVSGEGRQILVRSTRDPRAVRDVVSVPPGSTIVDPSTTVPPLAAASDSPIDLALVALDRGEIVRAIACAEGAIADAPNDARAHLVAGLARFSSARYAEAAARFETVCELAEGAWVAHYHLGLSRERLGWFAGAREAFARVAGAHGTGFDLPGGDSELARSLCAARGDLVRIASRRVAVIDGGGIRP